MQEGMREAPPEACLSLSAEVAHLRQNDVNVNGYMLYKMYQCGPMKDLEHPPPLLQKKK